MDTKASVYVRLRQEIGGIWNVEDRSLSYVFDKKKFVYNCFDNIYQNANNGCLYESDIKNSIHKFIENENVTVFAYGQTGSGKTYTMLGSDENPGIVQLALKEIFVLEPEKISLSFIELFNEKIYDLYTKKELNIYSLNNEVIIRGMHVETPKNITEALEFLRKCHGNRKNGVTEFNYDSSRSHGVFKISKANAVLYFIDLAGSERAAKDKNRLVEGGYINKSLLALGKLVNCSLESKKMHFRESKLTRILQSSFEQKTNIVAICTISSLRKSVQESISTLNFAARVSNLELKTERSDADLVPISGQNKTNSDHLKYDKIINLYKTRIENLENLIVSLLEKNPNQTTSEIYILEKQMFNLSLEEQAKTIEK